MAEGLFHNAKQTKLCGAKTRSGDLCKKHRVTGKLRCKLHGGLSTGPKTLEGKARCVAAHWKHGKRSQAFIAKRKKIWSALRKKEKEMRDEGYF